MTPREIAERMAGDAEGICRSLLPGGKLVGNEWCVGSLAGEQGRSLKVKCSGDKAGVWCDFNGGKGGDMIDLVVAVNNCTTAEAIKFGKDWCGIKDASFTTPPRKPVKAITPLKATSNTPSVVAWFLERGISEATMSLYRVVSVGSVVALPCYVGDALMHTKYRDTAKPKKEAYSTSKDSTPILFGWQAIPKNVRELVITEGEFDAMAYAEQGIPAVSVPMGAGEGNKQQWIDLDFDRLEAFDTIYLSMDMDDAGQSCVQHIVDRLGAHRVKVVKLDHKDANDALKAGADLATYLKAAKTLDPIELRHSSDFLADVEELFRPTKATATGRMLPWKQADGKFCIRPGELTVWTGFNGSGKSMVISHILTGLVDQGECVCVASMEMAPAVTMKRMFQQAGAIDVPAPSFMFDINDFFANRLYIVNIRGNAKSDRLLEIFRYAWKRYGVTQIVVDSLLKCGFDEDDYNGQKRFVEKLCDFSAETQCHIHLVSHSRKLDDETHAPGKMDVRGGAALTDLPDNVVSVWRNKIKEDEVAKLLTTQPTIEIPGKIAMKHDAILQVHKQRHFDWEGKIGLYFDRFSHQYISEYGKRPHEYVRGGAK